MNRAQKRIFNIVKSTRLKDKNGKFLPKGTKGLTVAEKRVYLQSATDDELVETAKKIKVVDKNPKEGNTVEVIVEKEIIPVIEEVQVVDAGVIGEEILVSVE